MLQLSSLPLFLYAKRVEPTACLLRLPEDK
jgi:hypothetical protein